MLRILVKELQRWSATKIGGIREQLLMARELIHHLDVAQETRNLSEAEGALRKRMKMRCLGLSSLERTITRQRSRIHHLSEGDTNTAYFRLIMWGRKRWNFIPSLTVAGHVVADHEGMEQALFNHFSSVFGTTAAGHMALNFASLGIQPVPLDDLDTDISVDEVNAAIKELPADRAPGPDGFTGTFYKMAWPVIRDNVTVIRQWRPQRPGEPEQCLDRFIAKEGGSSQPDGLSTDHNDP